MADQFDKWLSDSLATPHEDPMEARIHLAIVRDRLRRRRRRRDLGRILAVAVPALAAVMFLGLADDLGSDDFELDRRVSADGSTEVLVQGLQETGFQVAPGQTADDIAEIAQQRIAGEARLREVQGWRIGGKTYWSLTRVYDLEGREEVRHGDSVQPASQLTPEISRFLVREWEAWRARIEGGSARPAGTESVVLDGVPCTVRTYVLQSRESGEVFYYLGRPTP